MRVRRVILLTLIFSLVFTASLYADSRWGSFEGYSKAKVQVNDSEIVIADWEVPAFVVRGSTVLPIRKVAESLQAIVKWDEANQTAQIYKPNVHMFIAQHVSLQKDEYIIKTPFGKVTKGDTTDFVVFAQVDSLKLKASGFKISILTPSGKFATESKEVYLADSSSSFWYPWPFKVYFAERGNYRVTFSFKDEKGDYYVVSEKLILAE